MQELNIYGDVSGGWIFDQMDKHAHKYAISYIGDCLTASANITYFNKLTQKDIDLVIQSGMNEEKKCFITISMVEGKFKEAKVIATASFLFIKRK